MGNIKLSSDQILAAANKDSLGDALSDPLIDFATMITDQVADLAKERLRKLHGFPPDEPKPLPSLPENSVLRQAKTAEELGIDEGTDTPWTSGMDAKVPKG
jgi:hypothetical protein